MSVHKMIRLITWFAVFVVLISAIQVSKAESIPVTTFSNAPSNSTELNLGLDPATIGYHPDESNSWGESWFMLARDEAGNQIWVLFSINNYHPVKKFAGTVDVFYYPNEGVTYKGHAEFPRKETNAELQKLKVQIGSNVIQGEHPTYQVKAAAEDIAIDLTFKAETKGVLLGQTPIRFGKDKPDQWTVQLITPRAAVDGYVKLKDKELHFQGVGYFDHAFLTIKVPRFSQEWHVLRILQPDFSLSFMQFNLRKDFDPDKLRVLVLTEGNTVLANSSDVTLTAQSTAIDQTSNHTYPNAFTISYQSDQVKITGKILLEKMVDAFSVLQNLSAMARTVVKTLYADMWQYRLSGTADLTIERNGALRELHAPAIGELHWYKE